MIKDSKTKFLAFALWGAMLLFFGQGEALAWSQCDVKLPPACPANLTMEVATAEFICKDNPLQFDSFFDVTLSGVPDGFTIKNGTSPGWCLEPELIIVTNQYPQGYQFQYPTSTFSSLDPPAFLSQPPSNIQPDTWNKINALLNIKGDTPWFIVQLDQVKRSP